MNFKTILAFLCGRNRKKELYDLRMLQGKLNNLLREGQLHVLHQDAVGIKRVNFDHAKLSKEMNLKKKRYEEVWGEGGAMITLDQVQVLEEFGCQCVSKYVCEPCASMDEQEGIMFHTFGDEYLKNFVSMREERNRQLTDRKELLEYLQTQPALLQLLEDILMTPSDVDHSPIRRTKMLRIIRAWKDRKV